MTSSFRPPPPLQKSDEKEQQLTNLDSFYPPPERSNASAAYFYHVITALLLLLAGSALLALGIWLQVRDSGHAFILKHRPNRFLDFVLEAGIIALFLGISFIIVAVNALIARATRCATGCVYTIFAVFIFFLVSSMAVVSWIVYAQKQTVQVRTYYANAWKFTVETKPTSVCENEKALVCRGFQDNTCTREKCAVCPLEEGEVKRKNLPPCYPYIVSDLANVYGPTAILSTLLSIILLVDIGLHYKYSTNFVQ